MYVMDSRYCMFPFERSTHIEIYSGNKDYVVHVGNYNSQSYNATLEIISSIGSKGCNLFGMGLSEELATLQQCESGRT